MRLPSVSRIRTRVLAGMERLWSQLGARRRELPCQGATHEDPLIPPQLGDNVGLGHSILHRQIRGKFRGNRVAPERRPFDDARPPATISGTTTLVSDTDASRIV